MRKVILVLMVLLGGVWLSGCGASDKEVTMDEEYIQDAAWVAENCWAECTLQEQNCGPFMLCVYQDRTSEKCGFNVTRCEADACQSLPFDTCPEGYECGEDSTCHQVAECATDDDCETGYVCEDETCVEEVVDPVWVELSVCYQMEDLPNEIDLNWLAGQGYPVTINTPTLGQFSWIGHPTVLDPDAWRYAVNAEIGDDGCFSATVDLRQVLEGFWIDVTVGEILCDEEGVCDHDDPALIWWGDRAAPLSAFIDGVEVDLNTTHTYGRGYGMDFLSDGPGGEVPDYVFDDHGD